MSPGFQVLMCTYTTHMSHKHICTHTKLKCHVNTCLPISEAPRSQRTTGAADKESLHGQRVDMHSQSSRGKEWFLEEGCVWEEVSSRRHQTIGPGQ